MVIEKNVTLGNVLMQLLYVLSNAKEMRIVQCFPVVLKTNVEVAFARPVVVVLFALLVVLKASIVLLQLARPEPTVT